MSRARVQHYEPAPPSVMTRRSPRRLAYLSGALPALLAALILPTGASAATTTFGSPLSVPATLDTAANLGYAGTNAVQNGTGVTIHNDHDGADTALWNPTLASGTPAAPTSGQIVSISLEGCAQPSSNGPAPLTQFHFQTLTPLSGGGATVDVTSQAFDLPICGQSSASGSTISTFQPTNMCVSAGDFVDFNDEGGFDPNYYPSGVPYMVMGSVSGTTMSSYIDNNGTNNGDALSAMTTSPTNGFAANANTEVMLRATLGTGTDSPVCPNGSTTPGSSGSGGGSGSGSSGGGSGSSGTKPKGHPGPGQPGGAPGVIITPSHEPVKKGNLRVALFCAQKAAPCSGSLSLTAGSVILASTHFTSKELATAHIPLHLAPRFVKLVKQAGAAGLTTTMTVSQPGQAAVTGTITLIFIT